MKITKSELKTIVKQILNEEMSLIKEAPEREQLDDFFKFLARDPQSYSNSSVFYTSIMKTNKNFIDDDGVKKPNPYSDKIYKHQRIMFNFGKSYKKEMLKINPDYEFSPRRGKYENVEGFSMVKTGKNGLYFEVVPSSSESVYTIIDDSGQHEIVEYADIQKYLPPKSPSKTSDENKVEFRILLVDRTYKIKAGGADWVNPHFVFDYFGPGK